MSIQSLNLPAQIVGAEDKTIINEGTAYFTFWSDKEGIEGTMVVSGNNPEYNGKPFMLKVTKTSGESFSGLVRLILPPGSVPELDQSMTIFTIDFNHAAWHTPQLLTFLRY